MKKSVVFLLSISWSILAVLFFSEVAVANTADFSVQMVPPKNQTQEGLSYFDLQMSPKEKQTIEIEIKNSSKEKKIYTVEVQTAGTNQNGIIDYSAEEQNEDPTLPIRFNEIAKVAQEVSVDGSETKRVPITLSMPEQSFEGFILGGVTVKEKETKEETKGSLISHRYSYSIAIKVAQGNKIPEVELNLLSVDLAQVNRRTLIFAQLQNKVSTIVDDLSVDARVYREKSDKPLFYTNKMGLRMAPNSSFEFGIETNNQPLKAGKYRMDVVAKIDEQEWTFSEEFEITAEKAKKMNETAVELEKDNALTYIIVVGVIIGILVITIFFVWFYQSKKKQSHQIRRKGRIKNENV